MGDGLIAPKTVNAIKKYREDLDNAGAEPPKKAPEAEPAPASPAPKPITVAEAQAKAAKFKKDREDFEAQTAKGMPKPGLLDRAKKLIGL